MFSDYPSGFSSRPPPPSPLLPEEEPPPVDELLVFRHQFEDDVVRSSLGGGNAVVCQSQGVCYLETDIDTFDILHRTVLCHFGGTTFKGGVENPETVQTDIVTVGHRLAHLADDRSADVHHIFSRHSAQGFNVLGDAFQGRRSWRLSVCVSECKPSVISRRRFSCGVVCALLKLLT